LPHQIVTEIEEAQMRKRMSPYARKELQEILRLRYKGATKMEKTKILDEFVAVVKCHRKHAVRLLGQGTTSTIEISKRSRRIYNEAVKEAMIVIWEAADRICGKRLKAVLGDLIVAMERHGHLDLDPEVRERVLAASPATIDRLLAPVRTKARNRRKRRAPKKASLQVPIRTFGDWNEPIPGYLEIDFVAHCGGSMAGAFIHSFVATDVCSGWTESVPLLVREQSLFTQGLEVLAPQFPMAIL
jgi:hypothetical protein